MKMRGTEALTLEIGANVDAKKLVPERFEPNGRANVLLFKMTGLSPFGFDYFEALWRVSVVHEGVLAWVAVKCDIDHPIVRALGARFVRYPTREARIVGSEGKWVVDCAGTKLELRLKDDDAAKMPELRRTFVASGERVWEIPWNEEPPSKARSVRVTAADDALVRATFGEGAKLDDVGVVHRGRVHICGFAKRV
ncbi:MAG TPA: hypothetical protein VGH87_03165 [Polyangiaceae bacterium]|jgi:hypothetical protein